MSALCSWWVRRSCRSKALTNIQIKLFKRSVRCNFKRYHRCLDFWWPLIKRRAAFHDETASELLLNPVFRWGFLGNENKLDAFETQLEKLYAALGPSQFRQFHYQFIEDIANNPVENDAHNRILSAMVEVKAILHFASQGYSISLVHDHKGAKKADFCAKKDGNLTVIEVKYIRPPDKLAEFLLRWWQAQKEVAVEIPLGLLPHLKFEWVPVESRDELSNSEIAELKEFFTLVLLESDRPQNFVNGRLKVKYIPDRKLPPSTTPLDVKAAHSKEIREGIFPKIEGTLKKACAQLEIVDDAHARVIYLALNLSHDISFLWPDDFSIRLDQLIVDCKGKGVKVIAEEVGYL
ncbi:MAG: hypothetical protein JRJ11_06320 [Deltaproteobacteria bacterium]|nr:hypothetical protein [Deltaproteobacteria bacterium]